MTALMALTTAIGALTAPVMASGLGRGDVNSDGNVNIGDVTTLINYLLSGDASAISLENADINHDNSVNISDVTSLINYLLCGEWPEEPVQTFTVNASLSRQAPEFRRRSPSSAFLVPESSPRHNRQ